MEYRTEQEAFWAGEFGDEYRHRNRGDELLASNLAFFARALAKARGVDSCIEFGANVGMNLKALRLLYPTQKQWAIEINQAAAEELAAVVPPNNIWNQSILECRPDRSFDLVLCKGVLIHLDPGHLSVAYDSLIQATGRYLLVCEYYNRTPTSISYRGHQDRLFKRDFCGELLDRNQDLHLIDYGFTYHRDPQFPQDDISWFLMERSSARPSEERKANLAQR